MKQLKSFFPVLIDRIKGLSVKKIIIVFLAVVLLATPTAFAFGYVIYYEFYQKVSFFSVSVYDGNDRLLAFDEGQPRSADDTSMVRIFYDLTELDPTPANIPSDQSGFAYVRAVTSYEGSTEEFRFYFSTVSPTGYFTDSNGNAYLIPESLNKLFLSSEISEIFYESSKIYPLVTIDRDTVIPKTIDWKYKNVNGEMVPATQNKTTESQQLYEITGAIEIGFSSSPDEATVTVYDDNNVIYSDGLDGLSSLTVDTGNTLRVTIDAKWNNSTSGDKYGSVYYDFNVKIKNSSSFSISSDTIREEEVAILRCTNVTDISKLTFQTENKELNPVFTKDKNGVIALICISKVDAPQSYSFSVTYGAAKQDFTLEVLPSETTEEYEKTDVDFKNENEPVLLNNAIKDIFYSLSLPESDALYFRGNFKLYDDSLFKPTYLHNGNIRWGDNMEYSYTALGNEYVTLSKTDTGISVAAIENGIVSYIGQNEQLGTFVVVDHGCGLKSWYAGLSSTSVKVGDVVLLGQAVGKTSSSLTENEGFRLYCTVYHMVIDPNSLITLK